MVSDFKTRPTFVAGTRAARMVTDLRKAPRSNGPFIPRCIVGGDTSRVVWLGILSPAVVNLFHELLRQVLETSCRRNISYVFVLAIQWPPASTCTININ